MGKKEEFESAPASSGRALRECSSSKDSTVVESAECDLSSEASFGESNETGTLSEAPLDDECQATQSSSGAGPRVCCCKHKDTPRSQEFQADLQRRLNRAIGQLNGVKQMIDDNRYCGDVLVQLSAAETAVHNVAFMMLQDHMSTCVIDRIREGDDAIVDEAMQLIKRFTK